MGKMGNSSIFGNEGGRRGGRRRKGRGGEVAGITLIGANEVLLFELLVLLLFLLIFFHFFKESMMTSHRINFKLFK